MQDAARYTPKMSSALTSSADHGIIVQMMLSVWRMDSGDQVTATECNVSILSGFCQPASYGGFLDLLRVLIIQYPKVLTLHSYRVLLHRMYLSCGCTLLEPFRADKSGFREMAI